MHETDLIQRLRKQQRLPSGVTIGIGDDAAVMTIPHAQDLVVTTDMILEGVHFLRKSARPAQIGYKAMAVNLSDLAAMGARPYGAFVSVGLPRNCTPRFVSSLFEGMQALAQRFACPILGGDTNRSKRDLVINITMLGTVPLGRAVLRSGAQPKDAILVTGALGGSLRGKHLSFVPRVDEARTILQRYPVHAMMDISDGLASDLRSLCAESRCAAHLFKEHIPIADTVRKGDRLKQALCDGEDFELLFTMDARAARRLVDAQPFPNCPVHIIGQIVPGEGIHWHHKDGSIEAIEWKGYTHF